MNLFSQHSRQFILSFSQVFEAWETVFYSFNMAKPATFFANFPVNKLSSTSEVIRRYRSTYEGCALVPLVTSSIWDSVLIIHFQEAYERLFPNCYNKQGTQSNLPSYRPMNQGTICAKYILKVFNQSREIILD